ncbi:hypothetical protein GmHk_14G041235 [Glycine max]|nr:hypothetical protein GmHk_14G041235 [Glycine max]KAH1213237.1 hypothetical protein GmHk_14G041235 [Glycine max]
MQSYPPRTLDRRLQEDWARDAREDPKTHLLLEVSESYIKNWMQNSKRDVCLGVYLNGAYWQMVIILPKKNVVIWFCSLHNRPDNYLKGIINSALKGLDDKSKSKASAR